MIFDKIKNFFILEKLRIILLITLIFLSIFSIYFLKPQIIGDSVSYVGSMTVLSGGNVLGFTPYRITTSYLGLKLILIFNIFFHNLAFSWLFLNSILYIAMGMFFYELLKKILENKRSALLSTLFLITNYAVVVFGLHYLMDMGGWAFYVIAIYYSFRFFETEDDRFIYLSSFTIGIGGLFKEYSFLASIVVCGMIIWKYWANWREIIKKGIIAFVLCFLPMVLVNTYTYLEFHYTYLDWWRNQPHYIYNSKLLEYVKSFGSLYNFGWFVFLGGLWIFLKRTKNIFIDKEVLFIWLVVLSSLLCFVWAIVTRILFITIPGVALISSLFIKKIDKKWYLILIILIPYIVSSYLMDSYILKIVDLNSLLHFH